MSDLARVEPGDRVLEVGTGCGYQAAVLAELGCDVYSIERHESLASMAVENLREAGYARVHVKAGDGSKGWPEAAPFQAILVTAAAEGEVPSALVEQLAPGGRIVVPIEGKGRTWGFLHDQQLTVLVKDEEGAVTTKSLLPVAFVPLIEGEAAPDRRSGQT
jgi:protein-L-isoaspartate(D-aspartate) O-methyltransferase